MAGLQKRGILGWVGTALAVMIGIGVSRVVSDVAVPEARRAMTSVEDVEREVDQLANGADGAMLAALRTHFPADYANLRSRVASAYKEGPKSEAQLEALTFGMTRGFLVSHADDLAAAPDRDLRRIAGATRLMMEELAKTDAAMCAKFALSGFEVDDQLSVETQRALLGIATSNVEAIRHAIDSPVKRAGVTEADANAFVAFLSADGVPDGLLAQMENMAAMKAADACRVTISMYKAFELMPGDGAGRFHAYVLRESLKDAGKTA